MANPDSTPSRRIPLLKALLGWRCPRCRSAKVFRGRLFHPKEFDEMDDNCTHCGQDTVIEPGFYYGAMFVSYSIDVAVLMVVSCILYFGFDASSIWTYVGVMTALILVTVPVKFRLSRMVMLYFFASIPYEPGAAKGQKAGTALKNTGKS